MKREFNEKNRMSASLRTLDADLSSIMRAGQEFVWERVPFVLEAWFNTKLIWPRILLENVSKTSALGM